MKELCLLLFFAGLCHGVSDTNECTARGRFPNDDEEACRGYTMCLMAGPSNYIQYKLACPVGFVYSHIEQQCTNVTDYQCLPNYNCSDIGVLPNPMDEHCTSYVACVIGTSDMVAARLIECPPDMVFNPDQSGCVNSSDYNCKANFPNIDVPEISTSFTIRNISKYPLNFTINSAAGFYTNFIIMIFATISILF